MIGARPKQIMSDLNSAILEIITEPGIGIPRADEIRRSSPIRSISTVIVMAVIQH
jgi:hypothetical protein